ncbi:hypothetical protein ACNHKD_08000 [Methylocystis sp. JAN1]|uniref:hypothetical protein n=1 Tax=Methylocystis sp. JAN1 TaxID=3397211 RepID=UPI003FA1AD4F
MGRFSLICLAGLFVALAPFAAQAASRGLAHAPKTAAAKKAEASPPSARPIEPIEAPEKAPGAGWSGFYFGVNAGAARAETIR